LRPIGIAEADEVAHVLVDGARRPTSALVLSHWPASGTPSSLARDTSTESALSYLEMPEAWRHGANAVSLDHLDEDGIAACYALAFPAQARRDREGLRLLARAGDFDVVEHLGFARAAWALRQALDADRTPLSSLRRPAAEVVAAGLFDELFGLLAELLEHPGRFEALWAEEDEAFRRSREALESGLVVLEERPEACLAVITCHPRLAKVTARVPHGGLALPLHPAAIHGVTHAPRVLVLAGEDCTYYDRYETWVAYRSRRLPARRDLAMLAARLSAEEGLADAWVADPPGALVPRLARQPGRGWRLRPDQVVEMICAYLMAAPAAWFPHNDDPTAPPRLRRSAAPRGETNGRAPARWRGRLRGAPSA
jgi:hypothetical protein